MTVASAGGPVADLALDLVARLTAAGVTVATAESLTGGLVVARLVDCPGASAVVRGGIVAYSSDVKASLVGVDAELLATGGAVQAEVAVQLAEGARRRFGADWGIGTTGIAGPDPADGQPVGTVYVAVSGRDDSGRDEGRGDGPRSGVGNAVVHLALEGDRAAIRQGAVDAALHLLSATLGKPHGRARVERVT